VIFGDSDSRLCLRSWIINCRDLVESAHVRFLLVYVLCQDLMCVLFTDNPQQCRRTSGTWYTLVRRHGHCGHPTLPQMVVPRTNTDLAPRAFSVATPSTWNTLTAEHRLCHSTATFKRHLKICLPITSHPSPPPAPLHLRTPRRSTNAVQPVRHCDAEGFMFYRCGFSLIVLSFRRIISAVTEQISTKLGYIFTYDCYLKSVVQTSPGIYTPRAGPKTAVLGPTLNFDRTYLYKGT